LLPPITTVFVFWPVPEATTASDPTTQSQPSGSNADETNKPAEPDQSFAVQFYGILAAVVLGEDSSYMADISFVMVQP
jgi:hypothetical protein